MADLATEVLNTIKKVINREASFTPLHIPIFEGNEKRYLAECVDSNFVSSIGEFVDRFEGMLAAFTGVKKAVLCVNGTAALHICLKMTGVEQDDEVLMPALSFVATANAVSYCGAVPHFIDIEERTLGTDPGKLDEYLREIVEMRDGICVNKLSGRNIRAILPMHTFGHPVDMEPLLETARRHHLPVIEDAAESLGSYYRGVHTGGLGKLGVLSFNGNKIITTGGGGAILTNDEEMATLLKHVTTTAKVPHPWEFYHDMLGYNYRMPALNAALGCAQMEKLPEFLEKKRLLAERYAEAFADVKGVRFFTEPAFAKSNYWLNTLILDREYVDQRDDILKVTNGNGIMTRPAWTLMPHLPMYSDCPRMNLDVAEDLVRRIINIPSSADLV
ncbi:MAG: LegC family aminotransferase [Deltaproteobacteria bacterium]|nr:LegC family aminotransferase [Deltaproteobacteria bacterium]